MALRPLPKPAAKTPVAPVGKPLRPVAPPRKAATPGPLIAEPQKKHTHNLKRSKLEVFDIPIDLLVDNENNPNEMDEATFDQFVQKVKEEGFDEPIQVVPMDGGRYKITGGHHRKKAAKVLGYTEIPGVIKEGWSEDKAEMELVARNMMKGSINPQKFTELYDKLKRKGYDEAVLKLNLGFTRKDAFEKLYKSVAKSLPPAQRKKLEDARETVTSVDGLSSTLNSIFKEHGSDLDHNFCVFQFGGKEHHYIVCDKALNDKLKKLEADARDAGLDMTDVMNKVLTGATVAGVQPSAKVSERAAKRKQ